MTKILITGGAGFIGSSLVRTLFKRGESQILVIDDLSTGSLDNLRAYRDHPQFTLLNADVNVLGQIEEPIANFMPDFIFHYAAVVGVEKTQEDPLSVIADTQGIQNIAYLAKKMASVKRIFFSSSSEVYGNPSISPQNETTTPLNARLPYSIVKLFGETCFEAYHKTGGTNYTILRFFNAYGPHQRPDFVISKFIRKALASEDITIYGDGNQTRTFCFVDDNINATLAALEKELFVNDIVNIGSDVEITINDLAQKVIQLTNSKSKIIHLKPAFDDSIASRRPDLTRMNQLLVNPLTTLDEGLRLTLNALSTP